MFVSKTVRGYMQTFLLTEQEAYTAMLMAAGATQGEAFSLAFHKETLSKESADSNSAAMVKKKPGIKKLVERLSDIRFAGIQQEDKPSKSKRKKEKVLDITNKDCILEEYEKNYNMATDPNKKADILKQISDLQQMKKDDNKEDAKLVHFYVPLTCKRCNLYCAEVERKKQQQQSKNK